MKFFNLNFPLKESKLTFEKKAKCIWFLSLKGMISNHQIIQIFMM